MGKNWLLILLVVTLAGCFGTEVKTNDAASIKHERAEKFMRIKTTYGDILIEFNEEKAPITSNRIKELVHQGFYNGIKFHRVIKGFVVQGGDPTGTGSGGTGKKIKAEFSDIPHVLGTVAMARLGNDINSADCQFYISLGTHPNLDGKYTVFGKVVKGIEVAQKIVQGDKMLQVTLE